jgi:hypothetical protein
MTVQEIVELVVDLTEIPREGVEPVVVPNRVERHVSDIENGHPARDQRRQRWQPWEAWQPWDVLTQA